MSHSAITGAGGFLGWHLRCRYQHAPGHKVRSVFQRDFESDDSLAQALRPAEVVFHLGGMNRGSDTEVYETNIHLAKQLIAALDHRALPPTILFANSIHSLGDTAFGRSKREASSILADWAKSRGARYVDVILPHLFGEGGRPFYNSGFATFCHQLAKGEEPQIIQDGQLELIHAQRVAAKFLEWALDGTTSGQVRVEGTPMRVSEALARLRALHETYQSGVIPDLSDPLDLEFFNTYRSYLYPEHYPVRMKRHTDARGGLFEAVKSHHGGQAFLSTTHPGVTRGRHYHHHKVERFLVVEGEAEIRIRRLFDDEVKVFRVSGAEPCYIDMPTFHTHEITNVGDRDLLTLFWSHEIFDPARPDTYPEPVILNP
nr:NAD-dependent epimerase/dehydratase family protein [Geothrix sp. SG200]